MYSTDVLTALVVNMDEAVVVEALEAKLPKEGDIPEKMLPLPAAEITSYYIPENTVDRWLKLLLQTQFPALYENTAELQYSPVLVAGVVKLNPVDGALLVLLEPNEKPANTNSFFSSLGSSGLVSITSEGVVVKVNPLRENLPAPCSLLVSAGVVVAAAGVVAAAAAGVVAVVVDGVAMLTLGLVVAASLRENLKPTVSHIGRY